jgi:hypothetical protein
MAANIAKYRSMPLNMLTHPTRLALAIDCMDTEK